MTDTTGTASGSVSTTGGEKFNNNGAGTTPRDFNVGGDARNNEGSSKYPDYWCHKTRSGHCFIMDDSKGNETVTLQHRSGSALQMRPDGGVLLTTHNGKYEVILGEERVTISGASDITVKGDTSLRCYGDYNVTVHKDYNLTVLGNMNMTAKNLNRHIRGTMDTEAKIVNKRVEGPITLGTQASYSLTSKADLSMVATTGKIQHVAAKGDVGIHALGDNANMVLASNNKMYQKSKNDYNAIFGSSSGVGAGKFGVGAGSSQPVYQVKVTSSGVKRKTKGHHNHEINGSKTTKATQNINNFSSGGDITHKSDSGTFQVQSNDIMHKAASAFKAFAGSTMNMQAPTGTATFAGGVTNVNALTGVLNMAAGAAGINLDALGGLLNLNGGIIGALQQVLNLQLSFDFGESGDASEPPELKGTQADQPKEEPDATSEIDSWQ